MRCFSSRDFRWGNELPTCAHRNSEIRAIQSCWLDRNSSNISFPNLIKLGCDFLKFPKPMTFRRVVRLRLRRVSATQKITLAIAAKSHLLTFLAAVAKILALTASFFASGAKN